MGLGLRHFGAIMVAILADLVGCTPMNLITPADNVKDQTWYYECCDPSLNQTEKTLCQIAEVSKEHVLRDKDNNRSVYVWTGCEIGEEPWRKYEDLNWRPYGKSRQLDYPKAN